MKMKSLLVHVQDDAAAISKKLESIRKQMNQLPSFKGKAALADKVIAVSNRMQTLRANLKDELYSQRIRDGYRQ
jgi:hypothetical protein